MKKNVRVFVLFVAMISVLTSCKKNDVVVEEPVTTIKKVAEETTTKTIELKRELNKELVRNAKEIDEKTKYPVVEFGKYDSEIGGVGAIDWIVVDKNDKSYLLVSRYIIDCKNYNDADEKVTWEECTLNKWLNNYFLNGAFSTDEISYMNPVNEFAFSGHEKVTLLNVAACRKYFGTEDSDKRNYKLSAEATTWAISNWEEVVDNKISQFYHCGSFFLTDNGKEANKAAWVGQYGRVYEEGQPVKLNKGDGVRPVIVVKKELIDGDVEIVKDSTETTMKENEATEEIIENAETESAEAKAEQKTTSKMDTYSNVAKEKYQSKSVPAEQNAIILSAWEYGRTPIIWIYVAPNTQLICNNSPNRSENFGYKAMASSGSKGCYIPIFSRGESYGQDFDGRLYSFDDYKKTSPEEMKFDNKFSDLQYKDYNVKELLSKKYNIVDVSDGLVRVGDTLVNVVYVDELDNIIDRYK